jgi:hypothetical protein
MKHSGEEKTRRDRGRRARKRATPLPQPAIPEPIELPEPPVLPDVYTNDRRSIHPTRKQQPIPPSKKGVRDDRG